MNEPHPTGLRPTLRQAMIVVAWAAVMATMVRAAIEWHLIGTDARISCLVVPVWVAVYPMPILAILLRVLDRPGRVRGWYGSVALTAANFVAAAAFALQDPASLALTGRPSLTFPLGPLLAIGSLAGGWLQWRAARPRACPTCGRCAVIPVVRRLRRRERRLVRNGQEGWCAACGAAATREKPGEWSPASDE